MALSMRILLAFPKDLENRLGVAVWGVHDRIDLGRIVRLSSLTAPESGAKFSPHERAGICMAHMILERLYERTRGLKREHLAPHFLIHRLIEEEGAIALAFESGAREVIDCGPRDQEFDNLLRLFQADQGLLYPSHEAMEKHNAILALRDSELLRLGTSGGYSVLTDAPLMWATCRDVASWLDDDQISDASAAVEAGKTSISCAQLCAWNAQLWALAECDARAIFLFPSLDVRA